MSEVFDSKGKKIGIFVIAYNAESHVIDTLGRIPDPVWQAVEVVYVVDDCSTDETVGKALSFDRWQDKVVVLRNRVNQRYGGNQKVGYQYALDHGLDVVVMLHADGQYAPESLESLLQPIIEDEADVVIGSRMMQRRGALEGGMPRYKFVGNIVLTAIENRLSGMRLSEFHSGYRAYSTELLGKIPFWENSDEWHFDTQILLQAKQCGARITEVAIPTYYGDEICHVNGIAYAINCILSSMKYLLYRKGVFYSRRFDVSLTGQRYFEKFGDPASSHSKVLKRLIEEDLAEKSVLELGVGDASLTKRLHELGVAVDTVEMDAHSAEMAGPYSRKSMTWDLDDIENLPLEDEYDIVVAADILEHLREPEFVLSKIKKHLKRGGLLIVSLPNVANIYVRLNLLLGRFPYHSRGLLDRTHLHFYTLKTARKMIARTGWLIEGEDVTPIPLSIVFPFLLKKPFCWVRTPFHVLTRILRGLFAYQGIFFCRNPNKPHLL